VIFKASLFSPRKLKWLNARLVGGLMLIAIGLKILLSHLESNGAF